MSLRKLEKVDLGRGGVGGMGLMRSILNFFESEVSVPPGKNAQVISGYTV